MDEQGILQQVFFQRWREVFNGVLAGYGGVTALTTAEREAVPMMFVVIEVIFTAFFSGKGMMDAARSGVDMTNWLYNNRSVLRQIVAGR
ncbi:MAG: hypothetical protein GX916_04770 [Clostridiales bacterium]|jgi:hypothetical protein|nr:hypothetical protein [Clostridiales bacterium]